MYAPNLINLSYYLRFHLNGCAYNGANLEALNELFTAVSDIPAIGDDELRCFWLSVPRGNAEDNDWCEEENGPIEEYYPYDDYWFLLSTKVVDGNRFAWVNDELIIAENPHQSTNYVNIANEILFLAQSVRDAIAKMQVGTYEHWVDSSLPIRYRYGYLPYRQYQKVLENKNGDTISATNKQRIAEYAENPPYITPIKELTLNRYIEICAIGYRTMREWKHSDLSNQQLFEKLADERNGGLINLPPDDSTAFDEWYAIPDKWTIYNPSHLWEVIQGSSRTRIHLYPHKTEDGYTFVLSGYAPLMYHTLVSFYLALIDAGIPTVLSDIETVSKILSGDFNVGIVPVYKSTLVYIYKSFPAPDVYRLISSDDEDDLGKLLSDPDVAASITWLPIEGLQNSSIKK